MQQKFAVNTNVTKVGEYSDSLRYNHLSVDDLTDSREFRNFKREMQSNRGVL